MLLVVALFMLLLGCFKALDALAGADADRDARLERFTNKYKPREDDSERYSNLYHSTGMSEITASEWSVSYRVTVGCGAIIFGLLILAILADTREPHPEKQTDTDEA